MIYRNYPKFLCMIGGVVILIEAIFQLVRPNFMGILAILITLLIFIMLKLIDVPNLEIPYNGFTMIVLGIVGMISASYFGGALIIIAGVIWFVKEDKKQYDKKK